MQRGRGRFAELRISDVVSVRVCAVGAHDGRKLRFSHYVHSLTAVKRHAVRVYLQAIDNIGFWPHLQCGLKMGQPVRYVRYVRSVQYTRCMEGMVRYKGV